MRISKFEVPIEAIGDFAQKLTELQLRNSIRNVNEDEEMEIDVFFEKHETKAVDQLEDYLDELVENLEEEDDDE